MPSAIQRVSNSVITDVISRPLPRLLRQRTGRRIAGAARGHPDRDLRQRHPVTLQQTMNARKERVGLRCDGVVQKHADVAFPQTADQIAAAQMPA